MAFKSAWLHDALGGLRSGQCRRAKVQPRVRGAATVRQQKLSTEHTFWPQNDKEGTRVRLHVEVGSPVRLRVRVHPRHSPFK